MKKFIYWLLFIFLLSAIYSFFHEKGFLIKKINHSTDFTHAHSGTVEDPEFLDTLTSGFKYIKGKRIWYWPWHGDEIYRFANKRDTLYPKGTTVRFNHEPGTTFANNVRTIDKHEVWRDLVLQKDFINAIELYSIHEISSKDAHIPTPYQAHRHSGSVGDPAFIYNGQDLDTTIFQFVPVDWDRGKIKLIHSNPISNEPAELYIFYDAKNEYSQGAQVCFTHIESNDIKRYIATIVSCSN